MTPLQNPESRGEAIGASQVAPHTLRVEAVAQSGWLRESWKCVSSVTYDECPFDANAVK